MMNARDNINDSLAQALAHYRDNTAQIEVMLIVSPPKVLGFLSSF